MPLIGNVSVGDAPVDANKASPRIVNEDTEDVTVTEGTRFYDLKFSARLPGSKDSVRVIINIEIQNKYDPGYSLVKRSMYYASRLISSQLNTVFTNSDYDKLEKVYSIWICTTPPKEFENTISCYHMKRTTLLGSVKDTAEDKDKYRIPNVIFINLGDSDTKDCDGIIRMLYTLLVSNKSASEKKEIAHDEYGIPMNKSFDEEVERMCNISTMYIERGIQQGALKEKISTIMELLKMGLSVDKIAQATHISPAEAQRIINENSTPTT